MPPIYSSVIFHFLLAYPYELQEKVYQDCLKKVYKTHMFQTKSACVSFKESLLKLNLDRYRLYEQLRRRPNQHFAQNYILYPNGTLKLAHDCKNRRKMRNKKMRAPGARNMEEYLYTLHYTLFR